MCPIEIGLKSGPSPEDEAWVELLRDVLEGAVRILDEIEAAQPGEPEVAQDDVPDVAQNDGTAEATSWRHGQAG